MGMAQTEMAQPRAARGSGLMSGEEESRYGMLCASICFVSLLLLLKLLIWQSRRTEIVGDLIGDYVVLQLREAVDVRVVD